MSTSTPAATVAQRGGGECGTAACILEKSKYIFVKSPTSNANIFVCFRSLVVVVARGRSKTADFATFCSFPYFTVPTYAYRQSCRRPLAISELEVKHSAIVVCDWMVGGGDWWVCHMSSKAQNGIASFFYALMVFWMLNSRKVNWWDVCLFVDTGKKLRICRSGFYIAFKLK